MIENDFGNKLKQARTRQGISLRQASEATKIRVDFLEALEGRYDALNLPDVYKRGFLKAYSRYLRLDPEEILRICAATHKENPPKRITRLEHETEAFAKTEATVVPANGTAQSYLFDAPAPTIASLQTGVGSEGPGMETFAEEYSNMPSQSYRVFSILRNFNLNSIYGKIALIVVGAVVSFVLVTLLISKVSKSASVSQSNSKTTMGIAQDAKHPAASTIKVNSLNDMLEELVLKASNDVHIIVRQEQDKKWLYSGNLVANTPLTLSRKGPVKIHFSNGSDLVIQRANGQKVKPGKQGVGWIEL